MLSFRLGDKVEVKTLGVWFPATVIRFPPAVRWEGMIYVSYDTRFEETAENSKLRAFADVADVSPAQPPERHRVYKVGEDDADNQDFTLEQNAITPVNGWKAYYAATRAIMNVNNEFFTIINDRAIAEMRRFWLNADYVKCYHASGEFFSGMSWRRGRGSCWRLRRRRRRRSWRSRRNIYMRYSTTKCEI